MRTCHHGSSAISSSSQLRPVHLSINQTIWHHQKISSLISQLLPQPCPLTNYPQAFICRHQFPGACPSIPPSPALLHIAGSPEHNEPQVPVSGLPLMPYYHLSPSPASLEVPPCSLLLAALPNLTPKSHPIPTGINLLKCLLASGVFGSW